jgi:hypothetical protein
MSGDLTKILAIRDEMDSGKRPDFARIIRGGGAQAVHVVAGVMKLFLRLLPHPLFTEALYDELLAAHSAVKDASPADKLVAYRPLVARIPKSAQVLFATLSDFVNRFIVMHEERNKMTYANLAVIFGPVFVFKNNLSPMEELSNASRVNGVVREFFEAGRELFADVHALPGIPAAHGETDTKQVPAPAALTPVASTGSGSLIMGNRRNVMGTNRQRNSQNLRPAAPPPQAPGVEKKEEAPEEEEEEVVVVEETKKKDEAPAAGGSHKPQKPLPPIPRSAMVAAAAAAVAENEVDEDDDDEEEASD